MAKRTDIKKILVIGSGPIVIGQAAEFDYAGTQACLALKEEGYEVILCNSNPATIMTDPAIADKVYMEPLTLEYMAKIVRHERPDAIVPGIGGQTGLNLAMQLEKKGVLKECQTELLGTRSDSIRQAEDRELFKELCEKLGEPVLPSSIANTVEEAVQAACSIGYPVVLRPAFTLGGTGGGFADDEKEFLGLIKNALALSPVHQVLIEKSIKGFKEIEYEVIRDSNDTAITVCNMENLDPVGIHTGDSSQTLTNKEYQMLRDSALRLIRALQVEGGCNVQFALDPHSFQYYVIEVNPRVSRSSALASKASGYPIARVSAKISVGMTLDEIPLVNTPASFEPALDYVVTKMPRFPFDKFADANQRLGTQMKATGEAMSIGSNLEECLLKAVRSLETGACHLHLEKFDDKTDQELFGYIEEFRDDNIFAVAELLRRGVEVEKIHEVTKITEFFLNSVKKIVEKERELAEKVGDEKALAEAKAMGFSDEYIAGLWGKKEEEIYKIRKEKAITPVYRMADTFHTGAYIPYFYSSYQGKNASVKTEKKKIIVLGAGPIRIGQGVEFDYSTVHAVTTIKKAGYEAIIINNNPETVSTDYTTGDKLYFEPLTVEDVMNVIKVEKPVGVVVAFGGQTAIKLTKFLDDNGIKILGTSAQGIDIAEDRDKFDKLLEKFGIFRPKGTSVTTLEGALEAGNRLGYPVLLRPSYVIGGQNMTIAYTDEDVERYMGIILAQGIENPVLVDKYMMGTELEVDCISDGEKVLIPGIMEHIERAGVHSGDSIAVYPPYNINDKMLRKICDVSEKLALSLGTKGLVNIQYLIYQNELYVIEVNPRASRTIPYISKVTGVPMVELATKIMVGSTLESLGYGTGLYKTPPYFAVKVPVFSFEKLNNVNSQLGPEMKSTGEVLGVGKNLNEALFKGLISAGFKIESRKESRHGVLITVTKKDRYEIVNLAKKLDDLGIKIWATPETAKAIASLGIEVDTVNKLSEDNSIMDLVESGKLDYIVYTGKSDKKSIADYIKLFNRANQLGIATLTSLDTANALADIIASRYNQMNTELVDINCMRKEKSILKFSKMQGTSDDYIFFNNTENVITCPESFAIEFTDRHRGIGGIVLIEKSDVADAKMRIFNRDGSEGEMAGNSIRCVGKYLYDNGIVNKENITVETASGIRSLELFTRNGKVSSVTVDMGKAYLKPAEIPAEFDGDSIIARKAQIGAKEYSVTCVSVGNPHCVIFVDNVDRVDIEKVGPQIENADIFPERINTEFVRVVNSRTLKMRVWERGNGETLACGTGACAAAVAAVLEGKCAKGVDITVKLRGGDLIVNYTDEKITLTGDCNLVFNGEIEY